MPSSINLLACILTSGIYWWKWGSNAKYTIRNLSLHKITVLLSYLIYVDASHGTLQIAFSAFFWKLTEVLLCYIIFRLFGLVSAISMTKVVGLPKVGGNGGDRKLIKKLQLGIIKNSPQGKCICLSCLQNKMDRYLSQCNEWLVFKENEWNAETGLRLKIYENV